MDNNFQLLQKVKKVVLSAEESARLHKAAVAADKARAQELLLAITFTSISQVSSVEIVSRQVYEE